MVKKVEDEKQDAKDDKGDKQIKVEKDENEKALFIQRFVAFLLDIILVGFVASLISVPFIDIEKTEKYQEQLTGVIEKLQKNEITVDEYISEYSSVYYKISRSEGMVSIISILVSVIYFVVYQVYTKGQTLGKKLMKIRVVSDTGELIYDQMIFRSLIADFILADIATFILMLFCPKSAFFYGVALIEGIQYILVFISILMIMRSKEGRAIHDKLVHTKVIRE